MRKAWRPPMTTADMKRGTGHAEYAATRADFLPDGHLLIIVTGEHRVV